MEMMERVRLYRGVREAIKAMQENPRAFEVEAQAFQDPEVKWTAQFLDYLKSRGALSPDGARKASWGDIERMIDHCPHVQDLPEERDENL